MKDIKLNEKETVSAKTASEAAHQTLLNALSESKGYTMRTVDAIEALYPNDPRPEANVKNSFATAKSHCWTKADWKVKYTGSNREFVTLAGKRTAPGADTYHPIA